MLVYSKTWSCVAAPGIYDPPGAGQTLQGGPSRRQQDDHAFTDGMANTYGSYSPSGRSGTAETHCVPDSLSDCPSVTEPELGYPH